MNRYRAMALTSPTALVRRGPELSGRYVTGVYRLEVVPDANLIPLSLTTSPR
jgi:hypothetical protein